VSSSGKSTEVGSRAECRCFNFLYKTLLSGAGDLGGGMGDLVTQIVGSS